MREKDAQQLASLHDERRETRDDSVLCYFAIAGQTAPIAIRGEERNVSLFCDTIYTHLLFSVTYL